MQTWLSLKIFFMKLMRFRLHVHVHTLDIRGRDVQAFGVKEWEGIAELFSRTPGLQQSLTAELAEAIKLLDQVKKSPDNFGEVVRYAQRVIELWNFLRIPEKAANELAGIFAQMKSEQSPGERLLDATQKTVM